MHSQTNEDRTTQGADDSPPVIPIGASASAVEDKTHFDTFETHFFQQGDEASFADDNYYESGDAKDKRHLLSYRSMLGITIASSTLAIAACVALFRTNAGVPAVVAPAVAVATPAKPAPTPPAPVAPVAVAALPPASASAHEDPPAPVAAPAAPAPAAPAPVAANPAPAAAPAAPQAEGKQEARLAKVEPVQVEKPKLEAPKPEESTVAPTVAPTVAAVAPTHPSETRERCRQSMREKHAKEIVSMCSAAFAEDTTDADAAVAVAKVEFDRGRFAQAYSWSKKAIAVNPAAADAYVFAGGAEQNQGHGKAAKEAYLQYLRLAPAGRYAAELRTIVKSL